MNERNKLFRKPKTKKKLKTEILLPKLKALITICFILAILIFVKSIKNKNKSSFMHNR